MATEALFDPRGFWLFDDMATIQQEHIFDRSLAKALVLFFRGQSVIDFGCGTGAYVRHLQQHRMVATGFDGNPYTHEISEGSCGVLDLSEEQNLGWQADWVMSLEVGEHIPQMYEDTFLDNIVRHAKTGVVISWSTPELERGGGLGHVNCRDNEWVSHQMLLRGFVHNPQAQQILRKAASSHHFPFTLMVFRRELSAAAKT